MDKEESSIEARATVKGYDRTGVEMEAMTAVSLCLLAIYDMCKSFSKDLLISDIRLISKSGGKSDYIKKD
jgi:cyclic pyranopterin monophosphate synthase